MRNGISSRLILGAAILAWTLIGNRSLPDSNAQAQPASAPSGNPGSVPPDEATAASALPPDIDPNSPLAQVVRLVQAGVEPSVILSYINNSANLFNLSSDDIIYLNDLGVPSEIINAMMQRDQQLKQMGVTPPAPSTQPVETPETPAQPAEVTVNYFYDTLAPYGTWVDLEGYGWCWRPTAVIYDTGWQPYCNNGHWVYTDHGWFWMSGYSWGWAAFHYGRWFHNPRYGWCWWPNTTWAPSWVCWRYSRDYCGWAPLPPHAVYRPGVGFFYQGHMVGASFSFGLGASAFTFVPTRDFCDAQPWRHRIREQEAAHVYNHTVAFHKIDFDRHDRTIVNPGIPPHDITAVTRREIHPVAIHTEDKRIARGGRHEQFDQGGRTLIVNRPHFVGSPVLSLHRGAAPGTGHRQNGTYPAVRRNGNNVVYPYREVNQNSRQNFNRSTPRTPQITPGQPSQRNEFHRPVQRNENNVSPRSSNPARNNIQHAEANRNPHPGFNRVVPQTPQIQQPQSYGRFITPNRQAPNNAITPPRENYSPRPSKNQAPYYHYNNNYRILSPRARGFEQQSPHGVFPGVQQQGNAANKQNVQHFFTPSPNHNSRSVQQRQPPHQFHYSAPRAEPRNNVQHFNHFEPPQRVARPAAPVPSSSASSHQSSNQSRDNGQRGR